MEFNATFFVAIISFLVFTFIMNKIFYAPLSRIVREREEILSKNYADAENFDKDATEILTQRDEKLAKADKDARKVLSDRLESANAKSKNEISLATQASAEKIGAEVGSLQSEKENVRLQLKNDVVELAKKITSKVMGTDIKVEDVANEVRL